MNRLKPDAADARFLRRALLLILMAAVTFALYRAGHILILAFGSVLGAIAIRAVGGRLERHLGLAHRPAMIAAMAMALLGVTFLVWLLAVQFGEQINDFVVQLPDIISEVEAMLSTSPVGAKIVDAVRAAFAGSRVASDIGGLVMGSAEMLLNLLLLIVGALFLAASPGVYQRGFLLLIPRSIRPPFADALVETEGTLRLWLRAQIICMFTMGIMVGLGLWACGVPSSAALGLLAGLSEFIPYVGPTAAMIPALGIAATQGTGTLMAALGMFAVVRVIQTNFITPYVQKRVVSIPPAITLFAIIGIGAVLGLFGLFFSAAIMVVIFSLIRSLYLRDVIGEDVVPDEVTRESPPK